MILHRTCLLFSLNIYILYLYLILFSWLLPYDIQYMNGCNALFYFLGFRMAAECARNALLLKVVDNGADSGIGCCL